MSVLNILDQIAATSSKNEKIAIIGENLDNVDFRRVLMEVFNPFNAPYNIKKLPEVSEHNGTLSLDGFMDRLNYFQSRTVTGNEARDLLETLFSNLTAEDAEVAARIIQKDLRAGFSESSVNKARKGTIPVYPCLLATAYSEKAIAKITYPAYAEVKADGMRGNIVWKNGKISIYGRSGKTIHLHKQFAFLESQMSGGVLDGEFALLNEDGSLVDRKTGNGILNKAIRGTISDKDANRVVFIVWDWIPLAQFESLNKKAPRDALKYVSRFSLANNIVERVNNPKVLRLIEAKIVNNLDEAREYYEEKLASGEEGIILKNMEHPWENRRSQHLVKFKSEKECDLEVISWNPGAERTKLEGKLGSLVCASSDMKVQVSISGFSDELRDEIFDNLGSWMGAIVTVKYNERIADKDRSGVDSLFLPRFVEHRQDKDEADGSKAIK